MGGRDSLISTSARIQSNVVKALTGYFRLKDFIHAIRGCKTLAEERTLVARESAAIRTSFKEDASPDQLYHAIAKLLFIYMMGYPAHFGQVESLKMAAVPRMAEKRLGYLGSTQLMDEHQPTLTLITNSIKGDLNSSENCIVALALTNLATNASPDIARDLADECERLLRGSTPYIRKKTAFCAARLVNRVPELAESFEDKIQELVSDKDHGVVLGGIALAMELCKIDLMYVLKFRRILVPVLIRQLQSIMSGAGNLYSSDYDVGGITDPFLQVRILRLLRILGEGCVETSEAMSDVLTQISTSTDPSKNVGHAVLYEAAVTIMNIESDPSLRTMAINILGRLLSTNASDTNLRYVALTLLNKIICAGDEGLAAVQRHRATILECLYDSDVSIKRRAVDLSLALTSRETIRNIAGELLQVLEQLKGIDELEFKQSTVTRLAIAVAQYAPNAKWYVDMMIKVLSHIDDATTLGLGTTSISSLEIVAGRKEEIVSTFVRIVSNTNDLHRYATENLYRVVVLGGEQAFQEYSLDHESPPSSNKSVVTEAMIQATAWTMGEFGEILLGTRLATEEQLISILADWADCFNSYSLQLVGYIITALGKLSNRVSLKKINNISNALAKIASDYVNEHDIHYRACEMRAIVGNSTLRTTLLVKMPSEAAGDRLGRVAGAVRLSGSRHSSTAVSTKNSEALLSGATSPLGTPKVSPAADIFAELATLSLDGKVWPNAKSSRPTPVFHKDDVAIYIVVTNRAESQIDVQATVENEGITDISAILLQCAVPKSMKLKMFPANSTIAPSAGAIEQNLQVMLNSNSNVGDDVAKISNSKVKLRIKLSFERNGQAIEHQFDVNNL